MVLRVLVGLCVLACLALPLSAQIVPAEAALIVDSVEYPENVPDTHGKVFVTVAGATANAASVHLKRVGEQNVAIATESLPRVVFLERAGNVYFVRNIEGGVTVTVSDLVSGAGTESSRHTLTPGERRFFTVPVRAGASHHWVDIRWGQPGEEITLHIYAPDGTLGPYTDADDGLSDGRIFLDISSPEGLAAGDWYYEIGWAGGSGPVEFTFDTYGR
ncbi:hypothetical protein F8E02_05215 [Methanoculleus sp. Wushi-C6]|uniref:Uncharacterized protein n=1 Tax=Methanoculleus caldifontis TaxID=2651577 RepID=A0ABU3X036_9EURY|nr:hypothetical protein [Methanoculleus sp. Wushi-C6]MDV2481414.1 hypothetical protein [Methanoculleus sp. Wushi-C6]